MATSQPAAAQEMTTLLRHFDHFVEYDRGELAELLSFARSECPVSPSDRHGGFHLVTKYDDVVAALADPETFSSKGSKSLPDVQQLEMPPIDSDPPEHREYRRLLNPYFSRAAVARYEDAIREAARMAIAAFVEDGAFEVVNQFSGPVTAETLTRLILNLQDEASTEEARSIVTRVTTTNAPEAWADLTRFVQETLGRRTDADHDDILNAVLNGSVLDTPLTEDQRLGVIVLLFLAGLDTTRGMIAGIILHLCENPGLEDRLRRPDWDRSDLDEFLRMDTVVSVLARWVTRDTTLGGVPLRKGQPVLLHYYSANHDPDVFERPEELVFDRPTNRHIAFGLGHHRCIGSNLARLQIRVTMAELLARVTNIRLAAGTTVTFTSGPGRTPKAVQVEFDRRPHAEPGRSTPDRRKRPATSSEMGTK